MHADYVRRIDSFIARGQVVPNIKGRSESRKLKVK